MATITFKDGTSRSVDAKKAVQLYFILKELRPGSPEAYKYLEQVETISFKAKRYDPRPFTKVDPGRLPYADD